MSNPILFKLTDAGKNALLDDANTGLTLRLTHVGIGQGKYTPTSDKTALDSEISRHTITAGGIEPASHTLRFSTTLYADTETEVWEIGVFDENNILFAVASRTDKPLLKVYPDVAFVGSFGLTVDALDISHVQVVADPNGAMAVALMQQHLAHADPHPQYLKKTGGVGTADDLLKRIIALETRPYEAIAVGGIYTTTKQYANGEEVAQDLRYGRWVLYGQGRTLVGFSDNPNDWNEYKSMGNAFGENSHTLTVAEMPSHNHGNDIANKLVGISQDWLNSGVRAVDSGFTPSGFDNLTTVREYAVGGLPSTVLERSTIKPAGGNQPHNNIQPSIVVQFWRRVS